MQLLTFLSAAAAMIATASADSNEGPTAVELNAKCNKTAPSARIINRCDYPVYIWSTFKNIGCATKGMVTLKKGEVYQENYQDPKNGDTGVSIKVSKTTDCKGSDIVQLEYFLEKRGHQKAFWGNYLDVSYVDCLGGDCPTKNEGYYLSAGTKSDRAAKASADGSWCPILSCSDATSCAKMSYILPDDVQTKTCDLDASMDFYMCGSEAPSQDYFASPAPASSSKQAEYSAPKASSTVKVPSSAEYKVNVANVTPPAQAKDAVKTPKVKTKVVYVTAYEYVNAKRHEHAHAHARRHQPFHA